MERRGADCVPLTFHKWWGEGTYAKYGTQLDALGADIPDDVPAVSYVTPGMYESPTPDPDYRWAFSGSSQSQRRRAGRSHPPA